MYKPALVGVPANRPDVESVTPGGSDPEANVHEYGGVPPAACRSVWYCFPSCDADKESVLIVNGCGVAALHAIAHRTATTVAAIRGGIVGFDILGMYGKTCCDRLGRTTENFSVMRLRGSDDRKNFAH
jgi:hypothetical protein